MAKRGASKPAVGSTVRIRAGVTLPEHPDVSISGWTGEVVETKGRGAAMQYIVHWDAATIHAMPQAYRDHCEAHGLFYEMVCLNKDDIEATS